MKGFKFLAIRPLFDCDESFLKGLSTNEIYSFYSNCKYLNNKGKVVSNNEPVDSVVFGKENSFNVFEGELNNISINISAIVGKNGSGKSTLLELLYVSCYAIALEKEIVPNSKYFSEYYRKNHDNDLFPLNRKH
jgi:AAA15 family ATPase/GTPase